jgi:endonuclease/exonuclease/phosphatase family metal-dependent hydrolase
MDYLRKDWEKRGLDPEKDRMLVAGDFNCSLRNPEFAKEQTIRGLLKEGWVSATEGVPWPKAATVKPDPEGKFPAADFDHILLSPGWVEAVVLLRSAPPRGWSYAGFKAGVVQDPNKGPSDHYPVWMRLVR